MPCWGTSDLSASSVPCLSLSLSTMGRVAQVSGEEEAGKSRMLGLGRSVAFLGGLVKDRASAVSVESQERHCRLLWC